MKKNLNRKTMKTIAIAAMALMISVTTLAQNDFDKFEDVKGVSSMVMNQKMFKVLPF